jgi:hypothetical protein
MAKKIVRIAPVVVQVTKLPDKNPHTLPVVYGLDEDGGLWKWDPEQTTEEWVLCAKPLNKG